MAMYLMHRKNSRSGIRIADALGWEHGSKGAGLADGDILVRWGNVLTPESGATPGTEYNLADAIRQAANKQAALVRLIEEGIACLPLLNFAAPACPCLGRTNKHERGSGFFKCTTAAEVAAAKDQGAEYFVPWYDGFREYRVHVFLGRVLKTVFKRSPEDWESTTIQTEAEQIAVKATKALGLHFAAIDIIKHDSRWMVLEANTAPDTDGSDLKPWLIALRDVQAMHEASATYDRVRSTYPAFL